MRDTQAKALETMRWRVGRTLGRTIYAQVRTDPSKDDVLLGLMETRELAELVVDMHNDAFDRA